MVIDTMGPGGLSRQASTNQRPSCPDAFHDYLASDKTLKSMPIIGTDSRNEADVVATRLSTLRCLLRRGRRSRSLRSSSSSSSGPMRDDASEDKDPIQQCLDLRQTCARRLGEHSIRDCRSKKILSRRLSALSLRT